jgi:hypothetical protein
VIGDYTTAKTKKTYKAHFTIYNRFIKKCEKDDELPISYKGYFLMKNYPEMFEVVKDKEKYETITDFFQIKSTPIPEPIATIPEPEPEPIQEPKSVDGKWIKDEDVIHPNGKSIVNEYQNTYLFTELKEYENRIITDWKMKYLNPRLYENRIITDWNAEIDKPTAYFVHYIRKEMILVVKDYDTTPKRKVIKNKIFAPNPNAIAFLNENGFFDKKECAKKMAEHLGLEYL